MSSIVTRTDTCRCGGSITVVIPGPDSQKTRAQEIMYAVQRHNQTPAHQEMSRIWESEWLHPYDPGYPHEEVLPGSLGEGVITEGADHSGLGGKHR